MKKLTKRLRFLFLIIGTINLANAQEIVSTQGTSYSNGTTNLKKHLLSLTFYAPFQVCCKPITFAKKQNLTNQTVFRFLAEALWVIQLKYWILP